MTCQLTDGSEYEGGELEFDFRNYEPHMRDESKHLIQAKEILPKGSIIVFPSFVWHRVKPVTKGIRYSLVMWNLDIRLNNMKKKNILKHLYGWEEKPEFVKSLNKASNQYIKESRKREKEYIKKHGDFGIILSFNTTYSDNNFLDFRNYIGQKSWDFLDGHGYDMQQYTTILVKCGFKSLLKMVVVIIQLIFIGINMYQDFIF
jgi:hypothetical protein